MARQWDKEAEKFMHCMDAPDDIGESEYRLVHDFVRALLDDGGDLALVAASLEEIETVAKMFRAKIQTARNE